MKLQRKHVTKLKILIYKGSYNEGTFMSKPGGITTINSRIILANPEINR